MYQIFIPVYKIVHIFVSSTNFHQTSVHIFYIRNILPFQETYIFHDEVSLKKYYSPSIILPDDFCRIGAIYHDQFVPVCAVRQFGSRDKGATPNHAHVKGVTLVDNVRSGGAVRYKLRVSVNIRNYI